MDYIQSVDKYHHGWKRGWQRKHTTKRIDSECPHCLARLMRGTWHVSTKLRIPDIGSDIRNIEGHVTFIYIYIYNGLYSLLIYIQFIWRGGVTAIYVRRRNPNTYLSRVIGILYCKLKLFYYKLDRSSNMWWHRFMKVVELDGVLLAIIVSYRSRAARHIQPPNVCTMYYVYYVHCT